MESSWIAVSWHCWEPFLMTWRNYPPFLSLFVSVSPGTQISSPLLCHGKFLRKRERVCNNEELYPMLTKKFSFSLHENEDNSSPIKEMLVEDIVFLPTALLFLCLSLHCSSSAMFLPGRPAYELSPHSVLCFIFLAMYMQYCCRVQHRKHDVLNSSLKASYDSSST